AGGGELKARSGEAVATGDCCGFGSNAFAANSDTSGSHMRSAARKYESAPMVVRRIVKEFLGADVGGLVCSRQIASNRLQVSMNLRVQRFEGNGSYRCTQPQAVNTL